MIARMFLAVFRSSTLTLKPRLWVRRLWARSLVRAQQLRRRLPLWGRPNQLAPQVVVNRLRRHAG